MKDWWQKSCDLLSTAEKYKEDWNLDRSYMWLSLFSAMSGIDSCLRFIAVKEGIDKQLTRSINENLELLSEYLKPFEWYRDVARVTMRIECKVRVYYEVPGDRYITVDEVINLLRRMLTDLN